MTWLFCHWNSMVSISLYAGPSDSFRDAVRCLSKEWRINRRQHNDHQRILENDIAFNKWRKGINSAVTRCSAYGDEHQQNCYLFVGFPRGDSRAPVIQKGSRFRLYKTYSLSSGGSSPNGWCSEVLQRYLRAIKFTCFDCRTYWKVVPVGRLCRKHGASGRGWQELLPSQAHGSCWLNGKFLFGLTNHQIRYVKKLWRVSRGIEKLELRNLSVSLPR